MNISNSLSGIQNALQSHSQSANNIANSPQGETDLAKESVEQINAKNLLTMNVRVAKTQDKMVGELIDLIG